MTLKLVIRNYLLSSVTGLGDKSGRRCRSTFTLVQSRGGCKTSKKKGYLQSPVALNSNEAEEVSVPPLIFYNHFGLDCANMMLTQRDNTVMIVPRMEQQPMVVGGTMTCLHVLDHVLFRWCTENDNGSDHKMDDEKFGMEAEFVYYNCQFDCLADALGKKDGVTMMSVLLEVSDCTNYELDELIQCVCMIECPGAVVPTTKNLLDVFRRPLDSQDFFLYEGSLTFEPYVEDVKWFVFRTTLPVANNQIQAFRNLRDKNGNKICCNTRALQSLNGRTVYVPVTCALPDSIAQMSVEPDECESESKDVKKKK